MIRLRSKEPIGGLCGGCRNARIAQGTTPGGAVITKIDCAYFGPMRMRVEKCTNFSEPNSMSLLDMKMTAWLLIQDPKKPIGFKRPDELKERWKLLDSIPDES